MASNTANTSSAARIAPTYGWFECISNVVTEIIGGYEQEIQIDQGTQDLLDLMDRNHEELMAAIKEMKKRQRIRKELGELQSQLGDSEEKVVSELRKRTTCKK